MNRRLFLQGLGASLVSAAGLSGACAEAYFDAFHRALGEKAGLAPWLGVNDDLEVPSLPVHGRIPRNLRGVLYRNGPALFERDGQRYHHWFDGDGMVQAYTFTDRGVSHRGRFVRTEKFVRERAAGKFQLATFGTAFADLPLARSPDEANTANTNVLPHAGKLYALWEGGSARRLDPRTLETADAITWRSDLKHLPFSAHPKVEPDGTLWNFGTLPGADKIVLYHIYAGGNLLRAVAIDVPGVGFVHDFAVTQKHLVFLLMPLSFDRERARAGKRFVDGLLWHEGDAMRALVVSKADFTVKRQYELPCGAMFHFGNAWEDNDGTIRFDYVRFDDFRVTMQRMQYIMRGELVDRPPSRSMLVTLPVGAGAATQTALDGITEFPRVDPRVVGRRNQQLYTLACGKAELSQPGFSTVVRFDLETGDIDRYDYGTGTVAEEHIVVPRPGSTREGDAWMVGAAYDGTRNCTMLSVFDARNLRDGPVAQARLPYILPLGFHGNFAAA